MNKIKAYNKKSFNPKEVVIIKPQPGTLLNYTTQNSPSSSASVIRRIMK